MNMRIGIDIDNTLVDTEQAERYYCSKYAFEQNMGYFCYNGYKESLHERVGPEFFEHGGIGALEKYYYEMYFNSNVIKGAIDFINKCKSTGIEMYIITSRGDDYSFMTNENCKKYTIDMLSRKGIIYDDIIFSNDKVKIAEDLLLSYMFDDSAFQIKSFSNSKLTSIIKMEKAWNIGLKCHDSIENWTQAFYKIVK